MLIDFSTPLLDLDCEPITSGDTRVTLGSVSVTALLGDLMLFDGRPEQLGAEQKVANALLAQTIHGAKDPLDVRPEQIVTLKDRIGRGYGALIVMRAHAILDPKE